MEFLHIVLWIIFLCPQQCVLKLDASSTPLLPICINTSICMFQMQRTSKQFAIYTKKHMVSMAWLACSTAYTHILEKLPKCLARILPRKGRKANCCFGGPVRLPHVLWHASYGYAGCLNNINILNLSPFLEQLVDGLMDGAAHAAGAAPFVIGDEQFNLLFVLVDGIYLDICDLFRGSNPQSGFGNSNSPHGRKGQGRILIRRLAYSKGSSNLLSDQFICTICLILGTVLHVV
jgi:Plant transposon protein